MKGRVSIKRLNVRKGYWIVWKGEGEQRQKVLKGCKLDKKEEEEAVSECLHLGKGERK